MIVAVFSDVHGNLPALEAIVQDAREQADSYLCLGDVVNYGPWNDECLELVFSLPGIQVLEGNHERLFLGVEPIAGEVPLVQDFFRHSHASFARTDLITGLAQSLQLGCYLCCHTIHGKRIYADSELQLACNYVIGHSHHQFVLERSGHVLVNPGSVGQNRTHIDLACYALLDSRSQTVKLRQVTYPFEQFVSELRVRRYPPHCIAYYLNKPRAGNPGKA